jgi:UDP-3-O-[3-hydroxymyristoyl] glucosamine N-acyltransferase
MNRRTYRLEEIAHLVKGELFGDKDFKISNLSSLEQAQNHHICFVNGEKYLAQAEASEAGVYIVTTALKQQLSSKQNFIVVENPYLAFATLTHLFEKKFLKEVSKVLLKFILLRLWLIMLI